MLWQKAWLETRARFLASLGGITAVVVLIVHHFEYVFRPIGLTGDMYLKALSRNAGEIFSAGQHTLVGIWLLAIILLGMGGLIRERAIGVSSFTLALPVSRRRLVCTQIAVGVAETMALGVVPWLAILLTMKLGGLPVSLSQAAFYLGLLTSGGLIYLGLSVLVSSSVEGEYTAPAVAYGLMFFSIIVCASVESIRPYADVWRFMCGDNHFDQSAGRLVGPFPWAGALAAMSVAAVLLMASVVVTERSEF